MTKSTYATTLTITLPSADSRWGRRETSTGTGPSGYRRTIAAPTVASAEARLDRHHETAAPRHHPRCQPWIQQCQIGIR